MYNYYQPQMQLQPQQRANFLKGRPVSSIEEVRATTIDFDGSIFYFPDLANNRIYTKQINLDGTASLCMYELKSNLPKLTTAFITRNEFDSAIKEIQKLLSISKEEPKEETFVTNF